MKNLSLVLVLAVSLTACKTNKKYNADVAAANAAGYSSGQADAQANAVKAANLMIELQSMVGLTTTLSVVKFGKDNANFVVIKAEGGGPTQYIAIDVSTYTTGTSWAAYLTGGATVFANLTNNGNGTFSCSAAAGCANLAGPVSSSMVFEKTTVSSKDMDKAAAIVEAYNVESTAAGIAAQFGLSEERSLKVAKLAASWEKLAKTRALTNADADAFSYELTGVSISDMENAEKAMLGGSLSEMNAVLNKAAEVNGTTSENMSAIMMKLFF